MNGTGGQARFDAPSGIATDGTTVWVADAGNNLIRAIDMQSATVSNLAGQLNAPGTGDGTGNGATLESQRGLAWDGKFLYQIQGNGVLRQIDVNSGKVVTVAGSPNTNAFMDGVGGQARFDVPRFIEAVSGDRLYVSDTENHRIRLVTISNGVGTVSTPYGGAAGYNDANGNAALFRRQRGVAFAGGNTLAVADSDNFVIREIDLSTDDVTTIAGMAGNATHVVGVGLAAGFDKPLDMHYDDKTGDLFISEGAVLRRMYYK
jgi:hypothetical protein